MDLGLTIDGDLGRIEAGDAATTTAGVKGPTVKSVGQWEATTQQAGGTTRSEIDGALGFIKVAGDLKGTFDLFGPQGKTGSITIGGSRRGRSREVELIGANRVGPRVPQI